MTQPFEHQRKMAVEVFLKSTPKPQHGQKTDAEAAKLVERRSYEPRPGH